MNSRRIALWAALAAAGFWTMKAVAIGVAGGLDKSPVEGPLFFSGLLSFVVAAVALGIATTSGARTWLRILAGAGAFLAGLAMTLTVDAIIEAVHAPGAERHWVWTELNLWVGAVVVVAIALTVNRGASERQPVGAL